MSELTKTSDSSWVLLVPKKCCWNVHIHVDRVNIQKKHSVWISFSQISRQQRWQDSSDFILVSAHPAKVYVKADQVPRQIPAKFQSFAHRDNAYNFSLFLTRMSARLSWYSHHCRSVPPIDQIDCPLPLLSIWRSRANSADKGISIIPMLIRWSEELFFSPKCCYHELFG